MNYVSFFNLIVTINLWDKKMKMTHMEQVCNECFGVPYGLSLSRLRPLTTSLGHQLQSHIDNLIYLFWSFVVLYFQISVRLVTKEYRINILCLNIKSTSPQSNCTIFLFADVISPRPSALAETRTSISYIMVNVPVLIVPHHQAQSSTERRSS